IWGRRPDGMPAFPRGISPPAFAIDRRKQRSEFDLVDARQGWYADWTARCLGLSREAAAAYVARLLLLLADEGVVRVRTAGDGAPRVYGLQPGQVQAHLLVGPQVSQATLACDTCYWQQVVHPIYRVDWHDMPCPRYRCAGRLTRGTDRD